MHAYCIMLFLATVDAQNAGSGNLEIMINDGLIPCSVQNRGNRQFHASFMPREATPHFVQIRFNGKEVNGKLTQISTTSTVYEQSQFIGASNTRSKTNCFAM